MHLYKSALECKAVGKHLSKRSREQKLPQYSMLLAYKYKQPPVNQDGMCIPGISVAFLTST